MEKESENPREYYGYPMPTDFEDTKRMSFREEQIWLMEIENGIYHTTEHEDMESALENVVYVGNLPDREIMKRWEYTVVAAVCLASRAAVRGGMNAFEAFNLADRFYRRISECSTTQQLEEVYAGIATAFSIQVEMARERKCALDYIEACRDYIARHRKDVIVIAEMAKEIGINASYLSRKFKETEGVTLQEYILGQKLLAAANIIQYSNARICDISDYLSFASPSHMSQQFKKKYGMTPLEWRQKFKVTDFGEKYSSRKK